MRDEDLETLVRDALAGRADDADVTAPVLARARRVAAARRRTRWAVGAAAAAVVAVVGGVAVVTAGGDRGGEPRPAESDTTAPVGPEEWRAESYGGVTVRVPADWGYGGAPIVDAEGAGICGPGAAPGYVGRPILMSDACTGYPELWEPRTPYVWLGADIDPGVLRLADGYVQETVRAPSGTTVTVGSDDPSLRSAVLASITTSECAGRLRRGDLLPPPETSGEPVTMRACAYAMPPPATRSRDAILAAEVRDLEVADYLAATDGRVPVDRCPTLDRFLSEWIVLELLDDEGRVVRRDLVDLTSECGGIVPDARRAAAAPTITWDDTGTPWDTPVMHAVLRHYIGPQG